MALFKNNAALEEKFQSILNQFHQQLIDEGIDMKIERVTVAGKNDLLHCPCGTEVVIDSQTGQVLYTRCKHCH